MGKTIRYGSDNATRNPIAVAMRKRHAGTTSVMKDRRAPRGGARNLGRELLEDAIIDREILDEVIGQDPIE